MAAADQLLKILIVDDDEDDYFITSDYIKGIPNKEFTVDWSYNYNDAITKLTSHAYDIYFVDYRLGIKTGMDLLNEAIKEGCEAPIIPYQNLEIVMSFLCRRRMN